MSRSRDIKLGEQVKDYLKQIQGKISNLQEMQTYALTNGKTEILKHLDHILESFIALEKRYKTLEVMSEISKLSYIKTVPVVNKTLEATKSALHAIDDNKKAQAEMLDIKSSLLTSTQQTLSVLFKDFASPHNKFITFVGELTKFETTPKPAQNESQFQLFSQPKFSASSQQHAAESKLKKSSK